MHVDSPNLNGTYLSTEPASQREIRFAWAALVVSIVVFLAAAPFAKTPLVQVPAFIPIYVSVLVLCDLITSVLLFGQFSVLRSIPLLVLAGGYLFTASITVAYSLIFPGMFSPTGLFGSGPQTSSAMYMFWHSGFPVAIMAYTRTKSRQAADGAPVAPWRGNVKAAICGTALAIIVLVGGLTTFATWGQHYLPDFLDVNHTTSIGHAFLLGVWLLSLVALAALWQSGRHTVLDIWVLIVMGVWLFDIALAAIMNTGRYDLGWYVGRIYGLVSASFLLIVLLIENGRQYAKLVRTSIELGEANKSLAELTRHDGLTGLANRRFFDQYLAEQMAWARRNTRSLALVLLDVDHFKAYNDHYGHQAGDRCLEQVASALRSCCQRPTDFAARYGGEEFAFILPETDLPGAIRVAEAALTAISRLNIPHARTSTGDCISISAGISTLDLDSDMDEHALLAAADQSLYEAKGLGRKQVFFKQLAAICAD